MRDGDWGIPCRYKKYKREKKSNECDMVEDAVSLGGMYGSIIGG